MRGEEHLCHVPHRAGAGSPPHARGRASSLRSWGKNCGITPACAGKSPYGPQSHGRPGDHPRMRGEERRKSRPSKMRKGSPPHARGRALELLVRGHPFGITPACAGKRSAAGTGCTAARDHPRMRGEERSCGTLRFARAGSPPHARGRAKCQLFLPTEEGITPACAGKSVKWRNEDEVFRDHPRMRGEEVFL